MVHKRTLGTDNLLSFTMHMARYFVNKISYCRNSHQENSKCKHPTGIKAKMEREFLAPTRNAVIDERLFGYSINIALILG